LVLKIYEEALVEKTLRIAYLTYKNELDIKEWSGVTYFAGRALEKFWGRLTCVNLYED